jgi:Uma2 family endonuclease
MSTVPVQKLTAEQYLEIERKAQFKSEFYRGEMFAMSGASREHNLIANNIGGEARSRLRGSPCEVYSSDMRVRVDRTGLYVYPDVVVACGEPRFVDEHVDTLVNPRVLFEILSDSTEKYDRSTKMSHYMRIDSLQEYVLVSQTTPRVEVYRRSTDGQWIYREARDLIASVALESVGITLPLSEIYLRVEFPEPDGSVA